MSKRTVFGILAVPTEKKALESFRAIGDRVQTGRPERTVDMADALQPKSTLVYDGDCAFCRRWVSRISKRDHHSAFELVPRATEGLTDRFPKLAEGDFDTGMRLITPDDTVHVGADAAYQIARRLRFWRRIAWLYHVPGIHWGTRAAYAWIAAHRQSLGGTCDDGTCKPP